MPFLNLIEKRVSFDAVPPSSVRSAGTDRETISSTDQRVPCAYEEKLIPVLTVGTYLLCLFGWRDLDLNVGLV